MKGVNTSPFCNISSPARYQIARKVLSVIKEGAVILYRVARVRQMFPVVPTFVSRRAMRPQSHRLQELSASSCTGSLAIDGRDNFSRKSIA